MNKRENRLLSEFSPHLIEAIILTEDKRFRYHLGVDPLAALRALFQNLSQGKIVSGASTITMQLARLSMGLAPGPRTYKRKLKEVLVALTIERHHDKDEILALYMNWAPLGGPNLGFQAAARSWFGKSASFLSPAEAAFLAGLPARSPAPGQLVSQNSLFRKNMILKKLRKSGHLSQETFNRALRENLILAQANQAFLAPHFTNLVAKNLPALPPTQIATTLDMDLQSQIESLAQITVEKFKANGLTQVAVVVLSVPEREILAYLGSSDFFNPRDGQIDGVISPRQPGSALKPFIYALGLESGAISASSLINDLPVDFVVEDGSYSPRNYSGESHGPVSARLALASSLNVPAINLTAHLGVEKVLEYLKKLGLNTLTHEADHYGLGLALGGGEVTLLDLTLAYAVLADQGLHKPAQTSLAQKPQPALERQVMDPNVAFIISDILSDDQARSTGFMPNGPLATPYRSSAKTGTSKNFRDNWSLGYTDGFVIGVWAGNFQNQPMTQVSGITGAGYLWRQVADLMAEKRPPLKLLTPPPKVTALAVCPISGLPAGAECPNLKMEYFLNSAVKGPRCLHSRMNFIEATSSPRPGQIPVVGLKTRFGLLDPKSGQIYAFDPGIPAPFQVIKATVQATPDLDELIVFHNGQEIDRRQISGPTKAKVALSLTRGRQLLEVAGLKDGQKVASDRAVFFVK
jgi:penicillin-binding protein 1C